AFALPLSVRHATGLDWHHLGTDDQELSYGENRVDLSYGLKLHQWIGAGGTLKYVSRDIGLDGTTGRHGGGFGADFGLLAEPLRGLRLGLVSKDAFDTRLQYVGGPAVVAYHRTVRGSGCYSFGRFATTVFDVDDRYHLGVEIRPLEQVALRAGLERDREAGEDVTYTAGLGVRVGPLRFDYAYVQHPVLPATTYVQLTTSFNFNPP